ncbi:hypothetical protein [Streptosporangium sp. NPDC049376]|uniref:hypothetical protein n=1 Tax=Streptosporangium sp. NPDC049376 TaxID=3366192 RepID=UPI0037B2D165
MKRSSFVLVAVLMCALVSSTACQVSSREFDRSPLPEAAAPPYLCGHIPQRAVELMTGVSNPLVRGHFDLSYPKGLDDGSCAIYQRDGDQLEVLQIDLTPGGYTERIEEQLKAGALPLPEIVPGAIGYYFKPADGEDGEAYAMLVRGKAELNIQLERGVAGRDNAADVLALMKLIAPRLITDAGAPSASAGPSSSKRSS